MEIRYERILNKIINYGNIDNTSDEDNKTYIVYAHLCTVNGKIYIGQTCQPFKKRCGSNGKNYKHSIMFFSAIKKYGWNNFQHIVLVDGLSKEMADIVEKELIKKYNTRDREHGYNLGLGGSLNIEAKPIYQYDLDGKFLHEYKNIYEMKNVFGHTYHGVYSCLTGITRSWHGYMWSYQKYDKISSYITKKGYTKYNYNKSIYQYDLDGNYINSYETISDAADSINSKHVNLISACARGELKAACGFQWSYTYFYKMPKFHKENKNRKSVCQYDLNGNFICEYESVLDAIRTLNIHKFQIISSNRKTVEDTIYSQGFYWSYKKRNKLNDNVVNELSMVASHYDRTIYKYSFNGELVGTYHSTIDAARSVGHSYDDCSSITKCCRGKINSIYGFIWSYTPLSKEEVINIYHKSRDYKKKQKIQNQGEKQKND